MLDVIIIGGGPAGLSAAVYAQRYKLKTVVLAQAIGGTANEAHLVENYPGYKSISGFELMMKYKEHVDYLGGDVRMEEVRSITKEGDIYKVETNRECYEGKTVILAAGSKRRKLGIPGEEEFAGKGVSYCATCDGAFFRDKKVAVIGGADSAASAAVLLSQHAKEVKIIYRGDALRCEPYWIDLIEANEKISVKCCSNLTEIKGEQVVKNVLMDDGTEEEFDGIFIEVGSVPPKEMAENVGVEVDEKGYIKVEHSMATNQPGFYAAGDITTYSDYNRQIVVAASEGAIAAMSAFKFLKAKKQ